MNMDPMNVIPMVIESGTRGERAFDIYSLLKNIFMVLVEILNKKRGSLQVPSLYLIKPHHPEIAALRSQ